MSCEIVASFCYVQGDDVLLRFAVTDENGDPANLTGTTVKFAAVKNERPQPMAAISTESSPVTAIVTVTDLTGGLFEVEVDAADTADLLGTYRFEAELTDTAGDIATVGRGLLVFRRGIV
jgi:hypothetical protein